MNCWGGKSFPFHLPQSMTLVVARVSVPQKIAKQYAIKGGFFPSFTMVHRIIPKRKPIARDLKLREAMKSQLWECPQA